MRAAYARFAEVADRGPVAEGDPLPLLGPVRADVERPAVRILVGHPQVRDVLHEPPPLAGRCSQVRQDLDRACAEPVAVLRRHRDVRAAHDPHLECHPHRRVGSLVDVADDVPPCALADRPVRTGRDRRHAAGRDLELHVAHAEVVDAALEVQRLDDRGDDGDIAGEAGHRERGEQLGLRAAGQLQPLRVREHLHEGRPRLLRERLRLAGIRPCVLARTVVAPAVHPSVLLVGEPEPLGVVVAARSAGRSAFWLA